MIIHANEQIGKGFKEINHNVWHTIPRVHPVCSFFTFFSTLCDRDFSLDCARVRSEASKKQTMFTSRVRSDAGTFAFALYFKMLESPN